MTRLAEGELSKAATVILVVLRKGAAHGYAIKVAVARMMKGDYELTDGTLYRSLGNLKAQGLIEPTPHLFQAEVDDPRRKYYRITGAGELALASELAKLEKITLEWKRL